jgi:hypothetical protein
VYWYPDEVLERGHDYATAETIKIDGWELVDGALGRLCSPGQPAQQNDRKPVTIQTRDGGSRRSSDRPEHSGQTVPESELHPSK